MLLCYILVLLGFYVYDYALALTTAHFHFSHVSFVKGIIYLNSLKQIEAWAGEALVQPLNENCSSEHCAVI